MPIKKKKTAPVAKVKAEKSGISSVLLKKYGDIIERGDKVLNDLVEYDKIQISPSLDMALGGGIMEGGVVLISGDPKTGKTTTALHFAAKCQKLNKDVFYFNTEERLTVGNLTEIKGLDPKKMHVVQATDEQPIVSAEDYLNAIETCIKTTPGVLCIVDSVSNMLPKEELEGEIRGNIRAGLPRLVSNLCKRVAPFVRLNKAILILIIHNIANTGGSGPRSPKKIADSGNQIQYQGSTSMSIAYKEPWEYPAGTQIGQKVHWVIKTSASGGTPNTKAQGWIRYGIGVDEAQELAHIATEFSLIKSSGEKSSWYEITCLIQNRLDKPVADFLRSKGLDPENEEALQKALKFNGMANVTDFLSENDFVIDYINAQIKEMTT